MALKSVKAHENYKAMPGHYSNCVIDVFCAQAYSQTQTAMNINASLKYQKADKELNAVYQKILKQYSGNAPFIKNLRAAQRLWMQLCDAELAAKYPAPGTYGSVELCVKPFTWRN